MATNLIPNVGLDTILENLLTNLSHISVGSGTTVPALADTALQTEITRVATTVESASATGGEGTATIEAFFTTGEGNGAIAEWGAFDAGSGGNMYFHGQPVAPFTKTSAKQMRVTLTVKLRQAE